jgi:hypothetical protein
LIRPNDRCDRHHDVSSTIFELSAPLSDIPHSHYIITWWLTLRAEQHFAHKNRNTIFPLSLPFDFNLSEEKHLIGLTLVPSANFEPTYKGSVPPKDKMLH